MTQLLDDIKSMVEIRNKVRKLEIEIGEKTNELEQLREKDSEIVRKVLTAFEKYDIFVGGNHGWQRRMVFFLVDLVNSFNEEK